MYVATRNRGFVGTLNPALIYDAGNSLIRQLYCRSSLTIPEMIYFPAMVASSDENGCASRKRLIRSRAMPIRFPALRWSLPAAFPALVVVLMLSGCATSHQPAIESPTPHGQTSMSSSADSPASDIDLRLRAKIADWAGTPHVLGGSTLRGVDCSAFVQQVYSSVFNLQLPRTTREQVRVGERVSRHGLRPGDLVFFKPPTTTRHVGIYLKDGQFAHASSSRGVIISDLDEKYWDRAYWTSRRLLPDTKAPVATPRHAIIEASQRPPFSESDHARAEDSRRTRTGW
jgi:hypothetical protein